MPGMVAGEITYNSYGLDKFNHHKTSAYVSQFDLHTPKKTVRETLDFSARFQEIMKEVSKKEKQAGIVPNLDVDTYMKVLAWSLKGESSSDETSKSKQAVDKQVEGSNQAKEKGESEVEEKVILNGVAYELVPFYTYYDLGITSKDVMQRSKGKSNP
ncbi:pleiotropic drug resistance protein 3-like isoform X2 [Durio zibethinus]|uniref:Pleiotropic drug resistance protein 3-like isoform X2 n=1 Tax=Durio zibethinus TaxID=66656 RepID=A0A6P6BFR1_DURZI|nr:pleiotropic drug resistance protein 3-like isoform X2 [Durio zibethinus]